MTIPTRDEASEALASIDYETTALGVLPRFQDLATLRSYIESHTGEPVAWRWPSPELGGGYWLTEQRDAVPAGKVAEPLCASPVQPVLEWKPIESLPNKGDVLVGCWSESIDDSYSWEFVELIRLEAKGHDDTVLNINSSNFTHVVKHSTHWRHAGSPISIGDK